jgi:hypothetical protein
MTTSRQSGRNRKNVTPSTAKAQTPGAPVVAASPTPAPVVTTGAYSWTHDYDYVKKDLRKLGIVSAVLFIAIIVAGFFV